MKSILWSASAWTVDGLAIWDLALVGVVTTIVWSFGKRYMDGEAEQSRFSRSIALIALTALGIAFSNNLYVLWLAWFGTGMQLANLIRLDRKSSQAKAASDLARNTFLAGSLILAISFFALSISAGTSSISELLQTAPHLDSKVLFVSGGLLILSALAQTAVFPFHRWLLSSLVAPTPISALMHAGIVNAGGVLLVRFNPILQSASLNSLVFTLGAVSALLGSLWMLAIPDVKRSLASSTVAQMGFMMLQFGLGAYSAVVAHLILHGLYKAFKFLNAGSALESPNYAKSSGPKASVFKVGLCLFNGLLCGTLFSLATGKTFLNLNAESLLIVFAAVAGGKLTYELFQATDVTTKTSTSFSLLLVCLSVTAYGLFLKAVSLAVRDVPRPITGIHISVLVCYFGAWIFFNFKGKRSPSLYIRALNSAQPPLSTVQTSRVVAHAN